MELGVFLDGKGVDRAIFRYLPCGEVRLRYQVRIQTNEAAEYLAYVLGGAGICRHTGVEGYRATVQIKDEGFITGRSEGLGGHRPDACGHGIENVKVAFVDGAGGLRLDTHRRGSARHEGDCATLLVRSRAVAVENLMGLGAVIQGDVSLGDGSESTQAGQGGDLLLCNLSSMDWLGAEEDNRLGVDIFVSGFKDIHNAEEPT